MQYAYSLVPSVRSAVEKTLSVQRLGRYLPAASGNPHLAFRLYLWNIRLCEAFYLPSHMCEIALRNALHEALKIKYGREDWHLDNRVLALLPARLHAEMLHLIGRVQAEHGAAATVHHVVSGLSLGFWNNFLSSSYRHLLWSNGIQSAFPLAPSQETQQSAYDRVEQFRNWRNRIFHHNAIFDKRPTAELQNIDVLLGWCCRDTQLLTRQETAVSQLINTRPRV